MRIFKTACSFVILLLAGCAGPKNFVQLPDSIQKQIHSCDVVLLNPQKTVDADIKRSYMGHGLLDLMVASMVEGVRSSKAQKLLQPIQNEMKEFHPDVLFQDKLRADLQKIKWLAAKDIKVVNGKEDELRDKIVQTSLKDTVLFVTFRYALTPEFESLAGTLSVEMYPVHERVCSCVKSEDPKKTPIYKTHFMSSFSLPVPENDKEDNAKHWSNNNGALLKKGINQVIDGVLKQLTEDLSNYADS